MTDYENKSQLSASIKASLLARLNSDVKEEDQNRSERTEELLEKGYKYEEEVEEE